VSGLRIEGYAIVSSNGMLAADDGLMPNSLKFEADQKFFNDSLDAAALLVHGRMSHEGQPNSPNRRRLLLTRSAGAFSPEPVRRNVWLWNPAATPFDDVCASLEVAHGRVAIIGGTAAYDMFLARYARFYLVRAGRVELPGGVPVFGALREGCAPEQVLRDAGLRLADVAEMDPAHDLVLETWARD
jgi:dihydrofolate reductase